MNLQSLFWKFERFLYQPPEDLDFLEPRYLPEPLLGPENTVSQLFQHYLYLDRLSNQKYDHLSSNFWYHFHTFSICRLGLLSGQMSYKQARDFLYSALSVRQKKGMAEIYIFWFEELAQYEDKFVDCWNDRHVLKDTILEIVEHTKEADYQSHLVGMLLSIPKLSMSNEEMGTILTATTAKLLRILPAPEIFTQAYLRRDQKQTNKKYKRLDPSSNSIHYVASFAQIAVKKGFRTAIAPLLDYFLQVTRLYDPTQGDPSITSLLLINTSESGMVPYEDFKALLFKVDDAVESFPHGLFAKDQLLEALAHTTAKHGDFFMAYHYLTQIDEETTYLHTIGQIMCYDPDKNRVDSYYHDSFLPLLSKHTGWNIHEFYDPDSRFYRYDYYLWMLHWWFAAMFKAQRGDFSLLEEDDLAEYISSGKADFQIDRIAEQCVLYQGHCQKLTCALNERIKIILTNKSDTTIDDGDRSNAIEALLILNS